jgi:hypothetical protein
MQKRLEAYYNGIRKLGRKKKAVAEKKRNLTL